MARGSLDRWIFKQTTKTNNVVKTIFDLVDISGNFYAWQVTQANRRTANCRPEMAPVGFLWVAVGSGVRKSSTSGVTLSCLVSYAELIQSAASFHCRQWRTTTPTITSTTTQPPCSRCRITFCRIQPTCRDDWVTDHMSFTRMCLSA